MNNWKTLKEETPTECSICLITVNGNVTLATYSEGEFIQHGNDERHYNSVSAWQYTDPPYNNAKSKFERAMDYLRNDFENIKKYTEGELEFSLLGGTSGDEIFVVMPRCTADLDCINTIHRYLNGYTKVSNNDIGKILVLKLAPPDENIKQYAHWEVYYLYDIICNNTDKLMAIMDTLIQKNLKRRMNNEQNI